MCGGNYTSQSNVNGALTHKLGESVGGKPQYFYVPVKVVISKEVVAIKHLPFSEVEQTLAKKITESPFKKGVESAYSDSTKSGWFFNKIGSSRYFQCSVAKIKGLPCPIIIDSFTNKNEIKQQNNIIKDSVKDNEDN